MRFCQPNFARATAPDRWRVCNPAAACAAALVLALAALAANVADANAAGPRFRVQRVATGFDGPVWVGSPQGDARLFVAEREGVVRVRAQGSKRFRTLLDIRGKVNAGGGEQGLLSVAFHPNFRVNGRYFVYYTSANGDGRVVEYRASGTGTVPGSARQLLQIRLIPGTDNHNGGSMQFGPDDLLYIGTGDGGGGGDPHNSGQDLSVLRGKLLRIDVDGSRPYGVPAGNPFTTRAGARGEIFALGLRNPWRFSFDRTNGDLFVGDVGQGDREEVDRLAQAAPAGANFGWGRFEGTRLYNAGVSLAPGTRHTRPVYQYTHADGCSITGGYVYRGPQVPALRGQYLFADYCSTWIRGIRPDGTRAWQRNIGIDGISSFGEGSNGTLYFVSVNNGNLYRIAAPTSA